MYFSETSKKYPMPVFHLIYRSRANAHFSDEDLIQLLRQCRLNNAPKKITGLLLYGFGSFIQLLEGEEDAVRDLYFKHIVNDKRHREHTLLHLAPVPKRLFKDWSMAFRPMDAQRVQHLKGYMEPQQQSTDHKRNILAPLRLLEVMQAFSLNMRKTDSVYR